MYSSKRIYQKKVMKHLKSILLISALFAGFWLLVLPSRSFADPTSTQITCYDSKGNAHRVTATKTMADPGNILDIKDFKKACRQKGWTYQAPTAPAPTSGGSATDVKLDLPSKTGDVCGSGKGVPTSINIGCKGKGKPAVDMLFAVIRFLSNGVGLVIIGSIVYGGIQYTMSRGDPQATVLAVNRIRNALFALLLFLFAYALLNYLIPAGFLQ
jgi:hypothetical protein